MGSDAWGQFDARIHNLTHLNGVHDAKSRLQGASLQKYKDQEIQGCRNTRFKGFKAAEAQGLRGLKLEKYEVRAFRAAGFQSLGVLSCRNTGFKGFQAAEFQDLRGLGPHLLRSPAAPEVPRHQEEEEHAEGRRAHPPDYQQKPQYLKKRGRNLL